MARGKNKAIAERRREAIHQIGSIKALQQKISDLTKENQNLKDKLDSATFAHKKTVDSLNEQIENNTSSKVKELENIINVSLKKVDEAEEECRKVKKLWDDAFNGLIKYIMNVESVKSMEAIEKANKIINNIDILIDNSSYKEFVKKYDKSVSDEEITKRIKTLQKIRGSR